MGGDVRKLLTFVKAFSHSGVHSNLIFFFRATKKGKELSIVHERKQDKLTERPVCCWTSFMLVGILMEITT